MGVSYRLSVPAIGNARLGSSPRSTKSASKARTAAAFSVAPSRSPKRMFFSTLVDADGCEHDMVGEVHTVGHQRHQLQPAQIALHQFRQLALRADHEPLADCALALSMNRYRG